MRRIPRTGLLFAVLLAGCAKVHFTTWRGSVLPTQPYKKILVCLSPRSAPSAREIEEAVSRAFGPYPVGFAACLDVFPASKPVDAAGMGETIRAQGYDAVLAVERESIIHWSEGSKSEDQILPGFFTTYVTGATSDTSPINMGVAVSHQEGGPWRHVSGNFRLFDVSTGQLVWKSMGGAKAPNNFSSEHFAQDIAARNFEALAHDGLIPPAPVRQ